MILSHFNHAIEETFNRMEDGKKYYFLPSVCTEVQAEYNRRGWGSAPARTDQKIERRGQSLFVSNRLVWDFNKPHDAFALAFAFSFSFALAFALSFAFAFSFSLAFAGGLLEDVETQTPLNLSPIDTDWTLQNLQEVNPSIVRGSLLNVSQGTNPSVVVKEAAKLVDQSTEFGFNGGFGGLKEDRVQLFLELSRDEAARVLGVLRK